LYKQQYVLDLRSKYYIDKLDKIISKLKTACYERPRDFTQIAGPVGEWFIYQSCSINKWRISVNESPLIFVSPRFIISNPVYNLSRLVSTGL